VCLIQEIYIFLLLRHPSRDTYTHIYIYIYILCAYLYINMLSKREKKKKRKKEKERRKNNIINNQNCILITVSLTQIDHRQAQLPYIIFNYINFFFFLLLS